jgi:hypothetical protein
VPGHSSCSHGAQLPQEYRLIRRSRTRGLLPASRRTGTPASNRTDSARSSRLKRTVGCRSQHRASSYAAFLRRKSASPKVPNLALRQPCASTEVQAAQGLLSRRTSASNWLLQVALLGRRDLRQRVRWNRDDNQLSGASMVVYVRKMTGRGGLRLIG